MNTNTKILNGDVLIIDDILPKSIYNSIKSILYNDDFNWNAASSTALTTSIIIPGFDNGVSFSNTVYRLNENGYVDKDPKTTSLLMAAFLIAAEAAEINFSTMFRIRSGLILNTSFDYKFHYPHIDANWENIGGIIYFTDCDAPTRIYNEKYDANFDNAGKDPAEGTMLCLQQKYNSKLTTKIEIPCRENRVMFFDGRTYHSSSIPTDTTRRIAVNFNFI